MKKLEFIYPSLTNALFCVFILLYAVNIYAAVLEDTYESDDTVESAKVIVLDSKNDAHHQIPGYEWFQSHNFHGELDEDWFKYYAHQSDRIYRLDVYDPGANCDAVIEIFDADNFNTPIVRVNNHSPGSAKFAKWQCPHDGIYYFRISQYPGTSGEKTAYKVTLSISNATFPGLVYGEVIPHVNARVTTNGNGEALCLPNGMYYMPNPAGDFQITVQAPDFTTYVDNFSIGEQESLRKDIVIGAATLDADFIAAPRSGSAPLTVGFTDTSASNITITAWHWNFGDGNTSDLQNPTHTYNAIGSYAVSLTVETADHFDIETKSDYIEIANNPVVADFSATPLSGKQDLDVVFTDQSIGDITTRHWDFGDGFTSVRTNPMHTYSSPGIYTVSLTVGNRTNSNTKTLPDLITVTGDNPVTVGFSATPTSGPVPLTVAFTDDSIGEITSWVWDFGDGNTSAAPNPMHTYDLPGSYDVALTVSNATNSDTKTESGMISVSVSPVTADFSATPTSGLAPLQVVFTDNSSGTITTWLWDFGDENTSADPNPTHTYDTPGIYDVTLTVSNATDSDFKSGNGFITVTQSPVTAAFSATPQSGLAPLQVVFTDVSSGNVTTRQWDFGDGNTSAEQNPTHTYTMPGSFTVKLTVSNSSYSNTKTISNPILINGYTKAYVEQEVSEMTATLLEKERLIEALSDLDGDENLELKDVIWALQVMSKIR